MRMLPRRSLSEPPFGPANGEYVIFQPDEIGHSGDRIVRIGSHTGEGNLPARLREHMTENKDRSILRKHIGRAILRQTGDPYPAIWNLDYTPKEVREVKGHLLDPVKQTQIEAAASEYISRFSVSVLPMGSIPPKRLAGWNGSALELCPPAVRVVLRAIGWALLPIAV